jgi:hypothetical protein
MLQTGRIKKRRRWGRWFLATTAILLPILLWAGLHYRFRESLNYWVAKGSRGRYAFDAAEAHIHLWTGSVTLKNARLYSVDTTHAPKWMDIRIASLSFSLASWPDLLLKGRLVVDSLSIIRPNLLIGGHQLTAATSSAPIHTHEILNFVDSLLLHLEVRRLSLRDAAFTIRIPGRADSLHGEHIDLTLEDLARSSPGHLRSSGFLSLSLGRQHWATLRGDQQLDFARLSFDTRQQRFQLDSFVYDHPLGAGNRGLRLQADRLYFTSRHLAAILQQGSLVLDSLICINPILTESRPLRQLSSQDSVRQDKDQHLLFDSIDVRFVRVIGGMLTAGGTTPRTSPLAQKADLRIYGLGIHRSGTPLTMDSLRASLQQLEFLTPDSLYRLSIRQFGIHGNDAVFSDVAYTPARKPGARAVSFSAPSLILRDIDIPALLHKHLHAGGATLLQPRIVMNDATVPGANKPTFNSSRDQTTNTRRRTLFFHTLHNLHELIATSSLDIRDGSLRYSSTGVSPVEAEADSLNAHIQLDRVFTGDNLLAIKEAIPDWRVARIGLTTPRLQLSVDDYRLSGARRQTIGARFHVHLAEGWDLVGKDIFWDAFDWDILQTNGMIRLDSLHIGSLAIHAPGQMHIQGEPQARQSLAADQPHPTQLPGLDIGVLRVDNIVFDQPAAGGGLKLAVDSLHLTGIHTAGNALTWLQATAGLHDIVWENTRSRLTIGKLRFDSEKPTIARDMHFTGSPGGAASLDLVIPLLTMNTAIHSTDNRGLPPLDLSLPEGNFDFTAPVKNASLQLRGKLTATINRLKPIPQPRADIRLFLRNTTLRYTSGPNSLALEGLSAAFSDTAFDKASTMYTDRQYWLNRLSVIAAARYAGPEIRADAATVAWQPLTQTLLATGFNVIPVLSRDSFLRKARWQSDYISISGQSLTLAGIRVHGERSNLSIHIHTAGLSGIALEASRDKRVPFRHGIEKPMPTKLLQSLRIPIAVDSFFVGKMNLTYNELQVKNNRWISIHIRDIDAGIRGLTSRAGRGDTLRLSASGRLLDGHIRRFDYAESYSDSLSGFVARASFSTLDLTRISAVSIPAVAVDITGGRVDTAWTRWQGNRYAAYGSLLLHYDKLKLRVLNKKDSLHRGLVPTLETWAANLVLPGGNKRSSLIFFQRDREKFIFNYWVKSQTSGILSTLLHKRSDTYKKEYARSFQAWSLPSDGLSGIPH